MSCLGTGRKCAFGAKIEEVTEILGNFQVKLHKALRMPSGTALEAARQATAWRELCEARSSGEQEASAASQWRVRREREGREGRGSTDGR